MQTMYGMGMITEIVHSGHECGEFVVTLFDTGEFKHLTSLEMAMLQSANAFDLEFADEDWDMDAFPDDDLQGEYVLLVFFVPFVSWK